MKLKDTKFSRQYISVVLIVNTVLAVPFLYILFTDLKAQLILLALFSLRMKYNSNQNFMVHPIVYVSEDIY